MRFLLSLLLIASVFGEELAVTMEYVDYLKKTVTWEVEEYENNIFRGWTINEVKTLLGYIPKKEEEYYPSIELGSVPSSINWAKGTCDHGVKNQGRCGSCWAFAATGMLSSRCCLKGIDRGWLSPQELISCDKNSKGCRGGGLDTPVHYMVENNGLVPDSCFPYKAEELACPKKCVDRSNFKAAHVCKCANVTSCSDSLGMKNCLAKGPVGFGFYVCRSFMNYKSGIYKCDCSEFIGGHAVVAMGYSDKSECHYHARNSWGTNWGDKGYFDIACNTCNLEGGSICTDIVN